MNDVWKGKKKLWMWFPQPESGDLKLAELMVLAYRAYQDEYGEEPSIKKVCQATGVSGQTVMKADRRLINLGLLSPERVMNQPPSGWFQTKQQRDGSKHWRHHYTHWELMVRDPATAHGRLSHLQAALLSFLWHCRQTNFQPRDGWSVSYLSKVLKCKWQTARDGLLVLEQLGMIQHAVSESSLEITLIKPTAKPLALFQDTKEQKAFKRTECSIGLVESPVQRAAPIAGAVRRFSFDDVLRDVEKLTGYYGEEASDLAWGLVGGEWDFQQACLDIAAVRQLPLTKRRAALEKMAADVG